MKKIPWSCTGLEFAALPLVSKRKFNASRLNKATVGEIKVTKLYNCVLAIHCTTRSNTVYPMFRNNNDYMCTYNYAMLCELLHVMGRVDNE